MDSPRSDRASPSPASLSAWFSAEVMPHGTQLKSYLRGSFPSVRDVDDVVQESYLRLWKVRAGGPVRSVRALLFTVARRLAIDVARHQGASPIDPVENLARLDVANDAPNVAQQVERRERIHLLSQAVNSLPVRCREVFVLHKIRGLSRRETAEQLGLAERTVEAQTARAMLRCGDFLRRRGVTGYFEDESS